LLDDMRMRKLGPKTQSAYVRAVRYLASFLQRSPDTATAEDLRRFGVDLFSVHVWTQRLLQALFGDLT
jgi:hypothetical protein